MPDPETRFAGFSDDELHWLWEALTVEELPYSRIENDPDLPLVVELVYEAARRGLQWAADDMWRAGPGALHCGDCPMVDERLKDRTSCVCEDYPVSWRDVPIGGLNGPRYAPPTRSGPTFVEEWIISTPGPSAEVSLVGRPWPSADQREALKRGLTEITAIAEWDENHALPDQVGRLLASTFEVDLDAVTISDEMASFSVVTKGERLELSLTAEGDTVIPNTGWLRWTDGAWRISHDPPQEARDA